MPLRASSTHDEAARLAADIASRTGQVPSLIKEMAEQQARTSTRSALEILTAWDDRTYLEFLKTGRARPIR